MGLKTNPTSEVAQCRLHDEQEDSKYELIMKRHSPIFRRSQHVEDTAGVSKHRFNAI